MIRLERAGAEDLEIIIAIQRASFKAVYDKYQDEYDPYLENRERIKWKLVERPNSYYYFVKKDEELPSEIKDYLKKKKFSYKFKESLNRIFTSLDQ